MGPVNLKYFLLKYLLLILINHATSYEMTNENDQFQNAKRKQKCSQARYYFDTQKGQCRPLMACDEIDHLEFINELPQSYTKRHYLVCENGQNGVMMYSSSLNRLFDEDFLHGAEMLIRYQNSSKVVEVFGFCAKKKQVVMKYYPFGSADKLIETVAKYKLSPLEEAIARLQLAIDYVSIIAMLHHGEDGSRVMCDSNEINKALSQFVITNDWHLLALDLDALPLASRERNKLIKCGHRELLGSFIAPEQRWPFSDEPYDDNRMPGYDEKTDIWKLPSIVEHLLSPVAEGRQVLLHAFDVFKRCKSEASRERPSASDILDRLTLYTFPILEQLKSDKTRDEL